MSRLPRTALLLALGVTPPATACAGPSTAERRSEPEARTIEGLTPAELFARGTELAARGDATRAEQYLALALEHGHPADVVLPVLLQVCLASSRLRVALQYAEPHVRARPEDWALRHLVASIHVGLGDGPRARRELEAAIQSAPLQPEPHYLLAVLARDQLDDPGTSRAHFERYLELAPEGAHAAEARRAIAGVPTPLVDGTDTPAAGPTPLSPTGEVPP